MKDRLNDLLKGFRTPICEGLNAKLPDVEGLADYLLAEGVIVPPCKVGDVIFWLDDTEIKQGEVFEISIHSDGILLHTGTQFCLNDTSIFLTREEAEKALAKMQGVE